MIDVSMPSITGWEVAERLRAMPGLGKLKVVIVSANAHEFAPGGTGATHDAFLIKPIDMQRMLECLAAQLNLEWVYEGASTPGVARETDLQGALPEHSRHHVDDLYQLGLIGHVRGIQAKLREMETDPTNKPFATRMRTLVANFDLKRYMNVLEGMRKHG
jgi:CheY-like chemotaxis protein